MEDPTVLAVRKSMAKPSSRSAKSQPPSRIMSRFSRRRGFTKMLWNYGPVERGQSFGTARRRAVPARPGAAGAAAGQFCRFLTAGLTGVALDPGGVSLPTGQVLKGGCQSVQTPHQTGSFIIHFSLPERCRNAGSAEILGDVAQTGG